MRLRLLSQSAVFHSDGAVGDACQGLVVSNDNEGLSHLVSQVEEQLMQLSLVLRVETSRRFVGKDYRRVVNQSPCHGDTLLLTSRQFVRLMLGAVGKSHEVEQFHGALLRLALRHAGNESWNHDVFYCRELRQELVELEDEADVLVAEVGKLLLVQLSYINAVDGDVSAVGRVESADNLQESGLAGATRSDDAHHLTFVNMQVDALEHLQRAEALGDILNVYHISLAFQSFC